MKTVEYGLENKEVIVLLHGGVSWWNYLEVAQRIEGRFRVVVPILNGHSGSDKPFTTIEDNAKDIISYIDEKFGGRVLLIGGLSLGGQILVEMLSQRKDICSFAIIESALVLPMKLTENLVKPTFSMCYPLIKKRWFARLQFKSLHIKADLFDRYFEDTANILQEDMTAFLTENARYRLKDTLDACKAQCLVIAGGKEQRIMRKSAEMIAARLPVSKLEVIPGYYHGELSINHPEEYVKRLLGLSEM